MSRKSRSRSQRTKTQAHSCAETLRQLQREAIRKFIALLRQDERIKGQGYRLFVPREGAGDAFLASPTLFLVLPRLPRNYEEFDEMDKPVRDAFWAVFAEFIPQLGDLFFHLLTYYPTEWHEGKAKERGLEEVPL